MSVGTMAQPTLRVLVAVIRNFLEPYPELVPRLRRLGCEVTVCFPDKGLQPSELLGLVEGIDVCICGAAKFTADVLNNTDQLKFIAKVGAGFDDVDLRAATARRVIVTNVPGANSSSVAELTLGLMIALARNICRVNQLVKAGEFRLTMGNELCGKCLGIVGTGKIGLSVARAASALGMTLIGYDIVPVDSETAGARIRYLPLERLLEEADFVTVHTPLTSQTFNLIGKSQLQRMKSTAYLINVSRGGVVNELDLYEALKGKKIAGAALDVYEEEPPGLTALIGLENVVATPHMGGSTTEAARRIFGVTVEAVEAFLKCETPANVVNPEVLSRWPQFRKTNKSHSDRIKSKPEGVR